VRVRAPRVFDASAIVALFMGDETVTAIAGQAERGWFEVLLPTAAIADAEAELRAGPGGWEPIFLTAGLRSLELTEHAAVEIGAWPGSLSARHAVHEAAAVRGVVVTTEPGGYKGLAVSLLVVQ
jgi:hypothetical protein